jgi:hypothetical protein
MLLAQKGGETATRIVSMILTQIAHSLRQAFLTAEHLLDQLPAPLAGFVLGITPAAIHALFGSGSQTERTIWLLAGVWPALFYIVWRIGHDEKLVKVKVHVNHKHRAF